MSISIARLTLVTQSGDLIFEHVWKWPTSPANSPSQSLISVASPVSETSALIPAIPAPVSTAAGGDTDKTKHHRTQAVSSMLQVLGQLSRELNQQSIKYVKFAPKPTTSAGQNQSRRMMGKTPMGLGGVHVLRSSATTATSSSGPGSPASVASHGTSLVPGYMNRAKSTRSKKKTGQHGHPVELCLIEESHGPVIVGLFLSIDVAEVWVEKGMIMERYEKYRSKLKRATQGFLDKHRDALDLLPQTPQDRRAPGDELKYQQFRDLVRPDFAQLISSVFS